MTYDVTLRIGKNTVGKDIHNISRVHDSVLSKYLRDAQDSGCYIVSVRLLIPLYKQNKEWSEGDVVQGMKEIISHDYGSERDGM